MLAPPPGRGTARSNTMRIAGLLLCCNAALLAAGCSGQDAPAHNLAFQRRECAFNRLRGPAFRFLGGHFPHASGKKVHVHQHLSHEKRYGRHEQHFHVKDGVEHDGMRHAAGQKEKGNDEKQEAAFRRAAGKHEGGCPEARQALLAAQLRCERHPALGMFLPDHGVRKNLLGDKQGVEVCQADRAHNLVFDAVVI